MPSRKHLYSLWELNLFLEKNSNNNTGINIPVSINNEKIGIGTIELDDETSDLCVKINIDDESAKQINNILTSDNNNITRSTTFEQ